MLSYKPVINRRVACRHEVRILTVAMVIENCLIV